MVVGRDGRQTVNVHVHVHVLALVCLQRRRCGGLPKSSLHHHRFIPAPPCTLTVAEAIMGNVSPWKNQVADMAMSRAPFSVIKTSTRYLALDSFDGRTSAL